MKTIIERKETVRTRPPVHPGQIITNHHLKPLELTVTELAQALGVSRKTASKLVNQKGSVTPDMALRLSRAFNTKPQLWLTLQQEYDLWKAAKGSRDWRSVKPIEPVESIDANLKPLPGN